MPGDRPPWISALPDSVPPFAELRRTIEEHVHETSLRASARELGMSPTGVSKVIRGSRPAVSTVRALESWWLHRAMADPSLAPPEQVREAALRLLTRSLPPAMHDRVAAKLRQALDDAHRDPD